MTTLKSYRKLLDQTSNYVELIPHIQEILLGDITIEFGNSLLHTLSLLNGDHVSFEEWEELYLSIKSKLDIRKFTDTSYQSMMRLFCSSHGYQFIEKTTGFSRTITSFLEEMDNKNITFRRRTFFPIFQRCYLHSVTSLALQSYLNCQVRKISLEPIDLAYLLGTLSPEYHSSVIMDIVMTQTTFDDKSLAILGKIYADSEVKLLIGGKLLGTRIPQFQLSKQEQTQILGTLRSHVDNITRTRKPLLQKYDQFITQLKKLKYTVVIDGANVGRYNQGIKSQGELNLLQIHLIVKELRKYNQLILLCLNENHLKKVNSKYQSSFQYIQENSHIIETPRGLDDDLFWLYASIYKTRVLLVTNDELRNHIHNINDSFHKWREYGRITYDFPKTNKTTVKVNFPLPYEVKPFFDKKTKELYVPKNAETWHQYNIS